MPRATGQSVVVITGASSGIGRATALAFAQRGAAVAVAARRAEALDLLAEECRRLGGRALAVPTDVTREDAVHDLARRSADEFGRLDVWVNNAAVSLFARFEQSPPDDFRRVLETNLFGYVHGARAALPYFRAQGSGVLVNNASGVGKSGIPLLSAYVMAKFAIVGFGECLRQELHGTDIHVCTVLPSSIDTPLFQHAANYTGRAVRPLRPVYPASLVAEAIADLAEHPRRERFVGASGRLVAALHAVAPAVYEPLAARVVERAHLQTARAPAGHGNLFQPAPRVATISGGWRRPRLRRARRPILVGVGTVVSAAVLWLGSRHRSAAVVGKRRRAA